MIFSDTAIIVLAGGRGERFGGLKQFFKVNGEVILFKTIDKLLSFKISKSIIVIVPEYKVTLCKKKYNDNKNIFIFAGGRTRYESTSVGVKFLADKNIKYVYIHDGVRPFVNKKIFENLYTTLLRTKTKGAVSFLPVTDSVVKLNSNNKKKSIYVDKFDVITTQTPHLYVFDSLYECFLKNLNNEMENAQMMEFFSKKISYVLGPRENIKLTHRNDIDYFKKLKSL